MVNGLEQFAEAIAGVVVELLQNAVETRLLDRQLSGESHEPVEVPDLHAKGFAAASAAFARRGPTGLALDGCRGGLVVQAGRRPARWKTGRLRLCRQFRVAGVVQNLGCFPQHVRQTDAAPQVFHILVQGIAALEHGVGQLAAEDAAGIEHVLQHVFHGMGQLRRPLQPDHRRRALDAMEDRHESFDFIAAAAAFQGQQQLGEIVEREQGIVDEDLEEGLLGRGIVLEIFQRIDPGAARRRNIARRPAILLAQGLLQPAEFFRGALPEFGKRRRLARSGWHRRLVCVRQRRRIHDRGLPIIPVAGAARIAKR